MLYEFFPFDLTHSCEMILHFMESQASQPVNVFDENIITVGI